MRSQLCIQSIGGAQRAVHTKLGCVFFPFTAPTTTHCPAPEAPSHATTMPKKVKYIRETSVHSKNTPSVSFAVCCRLATFQWCVCACVCVCVSVCVCV